MRTAEWDRLAAGCASSRAASGALAPTDWRASLRLAEAIPLPWYRVQAMATVAAHAPDAEVERILTRAADVAKGGADAYQRLAVLAWVIETAAKRRLASLAAGLADEFLAAAHTISPLTSRAAALELLLSHGLGLEERSLAAVGDAAIEAALLLSEEPLKRCRKLGQWRIRNVARILRTLPDPNAAARLLGARLAPERVERLLG